MENKKGKKKGRNKVRRARAGRESGESRTGGGAGRRGRRTGAGDVVDGAAAVVGAARLDLVDALGDEAALAIREQVAERLGGGGEGARGARGRGGEGEEAKGEGGAERHRGRGGGRRGAFVCGERAGFAGDRCTVAAAALEQLESCAAWTWSSPRQIRINPDLTPRRGLPNVGHGGRWPGLFVRLDLTARPYSSNQPYNSLSARPRARGAAAAAAAAASARSRARDRLSAGSSCSGFPIERPRPSERARRQRRRRPRRRRG
jgi:hypothetical protein